MTGHEIPIGRELSRSPGLADRSFAQIGWIVRV
jgi:hypothetical protein